MKDRSPYARQTRILTFLFGVLVFSRSNSLKLEVKYSWDIDKAFVTPNATEAFKAIVGKFVQIVEETIAVAEHRPFQPNAFTCGLKSFRFNQTTLEKENDTDFLMIVTPPDKYYDDKPLIAMQVCQREKDRTVMGRLHLSARFTVRPLSEEETLNWLMHALLHALWRLDMQMELTGGIMESLHGITFSAESPRKCSLRQTVFNQETMRPFLTYKDDSVIVEAVKEVAEKNFECFQMDGAEIEDRLIIPSWAAGECNDEAVHWKKLHFSDDIMSYPPGPVITTLTATFMEKLGYNVSGAKPLKWAKGRKCDIINKGCKSLFTASDGSPGSSRPFCNWQDYVITRVKKFRCDSEYTQVVACDWRRYSSQIPKEVPLLFEKATAKIGLEDHNGNGLAGSDPVFDYCPVWRGIYDYNEKLLKTCTNSFFQPTLGNNFALEVYSGSSICIEQEKAETLQCESSNIRKKTQGVFLGAGCYEYKCEYGHLHLRAYAPAYLQSKISYVSQFKVCWAEGSRVIFSRMFGSEEKDEYQYDHRVTLICPSCKAICENNPRYKNFTCSPEVNNVNSRDYIGGFCGRGSHVTWDTVFYLSLLFISISNTLV